MDLIRTLAASGGLGRRSTVPTTPPPSADPVAAPGAPAGPAAPAFPSTSLLPTTDSSPGERAAADAYHLPEIELFVVDGRSYTLAHALVALQLGGEWGELVARARRGAALVERGPRLDAEALAGAAREFRYRRKLIARAEMEGWLDGWHLPAAAWTAYLRRQVALSLAGDAGAETAGSEPSAETLVCEAICSGKVAEAAREMATAAVAASLLADQASGAEGASRTNARASPSPAAASLGPIPGMAAEDCARAIAMIAPLHEPIARFRGLDVPDDVLRREIEAHALDWTWLRWQQVGTADVHVARELALCVRSDGLGLEEAAAVARLTLDTRAAILQEVEPGLRPTLLSAPLAVLAGPLELDSTAVLVLVLERDPPSWDNPRARERARAAHLDATLEREVAVRVRWLRST